MRPFGCKAYRNVTASITPEGELSGLSCDCPYDRGYCKNLAAALIYLESIFDYIMPDYLFSYRYFRQHYESPVVKDGNEQAKQSLQRIVKPFILRRMKSGVLTELPEKTETVLLSEMEKEKSGIYSANVAEVRSAVTASNGDNTEKIKILAMLTRLRQICCDPALVYDNYTGKSAKLEQCVELVESCVNSWHNLLLFSQFTSMLDIVAARLDGMGIRYFMLTGSTKPAQRLKIRLPTALTESGRRKMCRSISSSPGIPSRRRYASCSRQNPGLRISYSAVGRPPEIS